MLAVASLMMLLEWLGVADPALVFWLWVLCLVWRFVIMELKT